MDARSEAVVNGVDQCDGFFQGARSHDAQHRTEVFGEVVFAASLDTVAHTGRPELSGFIELLGLNEPLLTLANRGQCGEELALGGLNDGTHLRGSVLGVAHLEAGDTINELIAETLRGSNRSHQDNERCGRALLASVAEGGVNNILRGQVEVSAGGHDDGVLATGFCQKRQVVAKRAEQLCCFVATGQDHTVNARVRNQLAAQGAVAHVDQLECIAGNACLPECLHHDRTTATSLCRGLDDHRGASSKCSQS